MSKELIQLELSKETPDWLLVSKLAKEIHNSESETNTLGFRKGVINLIKVSECNEERVKQELITYFNSEEYNYVISNHINNYKKWAKSVDLDSKYHIVITSKPNLIVTTMTLGIEINNYNVTVFRGRGYWKRNTDGTKKPMSFKIKGDTIDIKFNQGQLRSDLRDLALKSLLA